MISTKKHIQQLVSLLIEKEIYNIVISPGSRNGPLIHTVANNDKFSCFNIVDERSAAYFALGLAEENKKPVAILCSSGSASLNYTPAISEAYYRRIPLIVLTADRPDYWIDQAESQCINQRKIYKNFVVHEISLPLAEGKLELWQGARQINEGLNKAISESAPIHINIPLEEPLHDLIKAPLPPIKKINLVKVKSSIDPLELSRLASIYNVSSKVLILIGQMPPNTDLDSILEKITHHTGAAIVCEQLSNLSSALFCYQPDLCLASLSKSNITKFQPDLLISLGGQFVSKRLKQFIRSYQPSSHWHISENNLYHDTYQSLTELIPLNSLDFLKSLLPKLSTNKRDYAKIWNQQQQSIKVIYDNYSNNLTFCDLMVHKEISLFLPNNSVLHLGNSTAVRYALFNNYLGIDCYANRGTSGIDGSLSTALGFATTSDKINTILIGDLSFIYDSNALWNKYISSNIRIIVINNGGGNIFGLIPGPSNSSAFNEHFLTKHDYSIKGIAKTFNLFYIEAKNKKDLNQSLTRLYSREQNKASILEVFTNEKENTSTFKKLFQKIKNKYEK